MLIQVPQKYILSFIEGFVVTFAIKNTGPHQTSNNIGF